MDLNQFFQNEMLNMVSPFLQLNEKGMSRMFTLLKQMGQVKWLIKHGFHCRQANFEICFKRK
ncbi:hypothetical protein AZI98_10180 [Aeribacillus pallidus]|uniref:Uncharacterized protein n=1 Tax=Aeribacillus pallidus TaxID=33936 RepID=A0A165XKN3_9BACI|nr:hypothetical protein AZI98_10180 [Aeribacillus pallidus]